MKKLLIGLTLLTSMSSFADEVAQSSYCQGRGQEAINTQKELVLVSIAKSEISEELQVFLMNSVTDMQNNHDYLCKGIRISNGSQLSAREKQLDLIIKGIVDGDISGELAEFFIENF